jgi:hydrogenase maturation protein HypF
MLAAPSTCHGGGTPAASASAASAAAADATLQRHAVRVRGAVQGVGFRPGVLRLAQALGLQGWVLNDAQGVALEVQGPAAALAEFERRLVADAPPLSRITALEMQPLPPDPAAPAGFCILPSRAAGTGAGQAGAVDTAIPPDTATCAACLAELFDPGGRRWRHPFINCTQCGPRFTLTRSLPYDRAQTSMAAFGMCPECLHEYRNPPDRRFHAEPNACPQCGPQLQLLGADGHALLPRGGDAIGATLQVLRSGGIVAIKGLGGFHLACDARNQRAVAALRQRKQREAKPFAVMAASLASAAQWVGLDAPSAALLAAPERPIVLLPRRADAPDPLVGIAPGLQQLGLMLPCTPIQFLLFHDAAGRPSATAWLDEPQPLLLVMTSANPGGEPLVKDNDDAQQRLHGIADAWLLHDRDILARCDDSVLQPLVPAAPPATTRSQFVRRARGYTPQGIQLARSGPPVLACGAWLKNTICITRGDQAFLSPHIGDLDTSAACSALEAAVQHLSGVLGVQPQALAHDLHPDFFSSHFAQAWAADHGLPVVAVQHHHAHIAAVAAEHGVREPLLGLALDGVGLGTDGGAWGGELLRVDGPRMQRLAHLATLPLPGGDAAAREPWRMAAAALHGLGRGNEIATRWPHRPAAAMLHHLLQRGLRCPPTSSLGRWFDAAAGLLGVCEVSAFEGQAPMLLQGHAATCHVLPPPDTLEALALLQADGTLDLHPLLDWLADAPEAAAGALLFHHAVANGLARWAAHHAAAQQLHTVALGGGCCLNTLLCGLLVPQLQAHGLRVLQAERAPPGDGGIALGQAWVALQTLHHD